MSDPRKPNPRKGGKYLDEATWEALKAAGYSQEELYTDQPMGPIIFSYSRKQAIEDGVLMDLCQPTLMPMLKMLGFKIHIAITATAFHEAIGNPEEMAAERPGDVPPGVRGVWSLLKIVREEIGRSAPGVDRIHFKVPVNGKPCALWVHIGPGDEGEPVLTIMLEGED